jgi:hypothetical protein
MTKVARGNERQKKVDKKAQLKRLIAFFFLNKNGGCF